MKAHEFCYWLQGFFELGTPYELTSEQVKAIRNHLNMVFVHEIDPKYPAKQQADLSEAHNGAKGNPLGGEFVAGPCFGTVTSTLGIIRRALLSKGAGE